MNFISKIYKKLNSLLKVKPKAIRGFGNNIFNQGRFVNTNFDVEGNNNTIKIGVNTVLKNVLIYIRGNNHLIEFGNNCYMGGGELWLEDENCSIIVKEKTTIENAHLAVTEDGSAIIIEEDCMLSKSIEIRTGDSHSIIDIVSGKRINKAANVLLQKHVWVGAHAKILKGVTIGTNAIIGTNAVVTLDVLPNSIAAGIPAKIIKEGITWDRKRLKD